MSPRLQELEVRNPGVTRVQVSDRGFILASPALGDTGRPRCCRTSPSPPPWPHCLGFSGSPAAVCTEWKGHATSGSHGVPPPSEPVGPSLPAGAEAEGVTAESQEGQKGQPPRVTPSPGAGAVLLLAEMVHRRQGGPAPHFPTLCTPSVQSQDPAPFQPMPSHGQEIPCEGKSSNHIVIGPLAG